MPGRRPDPLHTIVNDETRARAALCRSVNNRARVNVGEEKDLYPIESHVRIPNSQKSGYLHPEYSERILIELGVTPKFF